MQKNSKSKTTESESKTTINWDSLSDDEKRAACSFIRFTPEFIEAHKKDIDFNILSANPNLTLQILDKFPNDINWMTISMNGHMLTDVLLYNYYNRLYWKLIMSRKSIELRLLIALSERYRRSKAKNKQEFWSSVSRYQPVDIDYVDIYKRYIDFTELSKNKYLTADIIEKFIKQLDHETIYKKHFYKLNKRFIADHIEKFRPFMKKK